jgi:hypothetical protein
MTGERVPQEEGTAKARKPSAEKKSELRAETPRAPVPTLARLQQQIGNRAVQRLLAQRSGDGSFELDEGTVSRINQERSGGQPLEGGFQQEMGESMDHDFSGVRVHTSSEAGDLSQQIGAKAFTTGQDVFLREGAYDPHSRGGQELLAHELTHVVQQSGSTAGSGGPMTVTAPGDAHEQEADAVAKTVTGVGAESRAQRQAEEDSIQRQVEEEEEPIQAQEQEEEMLQPQEDEEEVMMQEEEEELAMPRAERTAK